jgi:hypothetical protein
VDVMVHLTDGEIWGEWPSKPSAVRQLIVAQVGDSEIHPPQGGTVIPVRV